MTNVLILPLPPQRHRPDTWLRHKTFSATQLRRKGRKKERKKENKVVKIKYKKVIKNKKIIIEKKRKKRATKPNNKSANDNKH